MVKAWEMLGGIPCNGICAYVNDTATFETSTEYSYLIEKVSKNFYRVFSKMSSYHPAVWQSGKMSCSQKRFV